MNTTQEKTAVTISPEKLNEVKEKIAALNDSAKVDIFEKNLNSIRLKALVDFQTETAKNMEKTDLEHDILIFMLAAKQQEGEALEYKRLLNIEKEKTNILTEVIGI